MGQYEGVRREKDRMAQRVKELERLGAQRSSAQQLPNLSQRELSKQIANMECKPLREASPTVRAALKKKLLIKWRPDKALCADHASFGTSVMQEMQNLPEWRM